MKRSGNENDTDSFARKDEDSESFSHDTDIANPEETSQQSGENEVIAKKETATVIRLRLFVLFVLVASTIGTALLVYFYTTDNEEDKFEDQFNDASQKVMESLGSTFERTLGAFDSLAVNIVSAARALNQSWPYVTIPDFGLRTSKLLPLSGALYVSMHPLVTPQQRIKWENYSMEKMDWVNQTIEIQETWENYHGPRDFGWYPREVIHGYSDLPYNLTRNYLPKWQNFPTISVGYSPFNWDWLAISTADGLYRCLELHKAILSAAYMLPDPAKPEQVEEFSKWANWFKFFLPPDDEPMEPISDVLYPIIDELDRVNIAGEEGYEPSKHRVVGLLGSSFYWRTMIRNILPPGSSVVAVFENECNLPFTYLIDGPSVKYLGVGDHHNKDFDRLALRSDLKDLSSYFIRASQYTGAPMEDETCQFTVTLYPSDKLKDQYTSNNPIIFAVVAVMIFLFTSVVFLVYDWYVERRQKTVMNTAVRSNAIVSSLFPSAVRDRIYPTQDESITPVSAFKTESNRSKLESFLGNKNDSGGNGVSGAPIAELYPETTVMFADIVGFTAWSSVRKPTDVFTLLETIYGAFDKIAKQRGVFKVETIGDSYVAVCGLPDPRKNHAVIMARFARDCREAMIKEVADLETTLGPGTAGLKLRIGLNSGPTTAGVLRGEKGRFQLFGDTVNTASRMESNGQPMKIQVSQKTADLLEEAGKGHWLTPREDKIHAKGKGEMLTYWCEPKNVVNSVYASSENLESGVENDNYDDLTATLHTKESKQGRLVEWHVDVLQGLLKRLVASREKKRAGWRKSFVHQLDTSTSRLSDNGSRTPRDEVSEFIQLEENVPLFDANDVELGQACLDQLGRYVKEIAERYLDTPFHNLDHCSHVAMSSKKLLDRIEAHEKELQEKGGQQFSFTYGITSDELAKFAIVFSALIHDVDHRGVPNAQLVKERSVTAIKYNGKSVAEQNSVDIAWDLLMQEKFSDLQQCIFASDAQKKRFRNLISNIVMSTDLFDGELKALRQSRWQKTFSTEVPHGDFPIEYSSDDEDSHRKATVILELIIQASDVAHTMQHFTIYKEWNLRLLEEMYLAYKTGRSSVDPTENWYEGEIGFFDFYVIPLAKKLKECAVFGVSCDEFLDYARDNQLEWKAKGKEIVRRAKEHLESRADISSKPFGSHSYFEI